VIGVLVPPNKSKEVPTAGSNEHPSDDLAIAFLEKYGAKISCVDDPVPVMLLCYGRPLGILAAWFDGRLCYSLHVSTVDP
jgi:hypothetical protein